MGRKRIARLMRTDGLEGVSRRKKVRIALRDQEARPAAELVDRSSTAEGPNTLCVADIAYIATWAGLLYLPVVLGAWSRRVAGWAMRTHRWTGLVLEALNLALWQRCPVEVVHHSDHGSRYTSTLSPGTGASPRPPDQASRPTPRRRTQETSPAWQTPPRSGNLVLLRSSPGTLPPASHGAPSPAPSRAAPAEARLPLTSLAIQVYIASIAAGSFADRQPNCTA